MHRVLLEEISIRTVTYQSHTLISLGSYVSSNLFLVTQILFCDRWVSLSDAVEKRKYSTHSINCFYWEYWIFGGQIFVGSNKEYQKFNKMKKLSILSNYQPTKKVYLLSVYVENLDEKKILNLQNDSSALCYNLKWKKWNNNKFMKAIKKIPDFFLSLDFITSPVLKVSNRSFSLNAGQSFFITEECTSFHPFVYQQSCNGASYLFPIPQETPVLAFFMHLVVIELCNSKPYTSLCSFIIFGYIIYTGFM